VVFRIRFSEEKNEFLKAVRGVSFEMIIAGLASDALLADKRHPDSDRPHQRIYVVRIENYAYAVPYVLDQENREIFLKTAYPSRKFTKQYLKGEQ
jgi:hypothetical protein